MTLKRIRLTVFAEVPIAVKEHRIANAIVESVVLHVVPAYDNSRPHVTVRIEQPVPTTKSQLP